MVELHPALRVLLGQALERLGLPVLESADVMAAAGRLDDDALALLVVDLDCDRRPPWPAALALAARAWARWQAPVLILAPWPEPELQAIVERDGLGVVLYKPFRLAQLEDAVRSLVRGGGDPARAELAPPVP